MSTSRQVVEQHGHHIGIENESGTGTTASVGLPSSTPPRTGALEGACAPPEGDDATPTRVLVVDDEKSIRRLLQRVLTRQGHQVDLVCDGNAALQNLQQTAYDVVFLDLNIPELPGRRIYDWIKANRSDLTPRTVILTGDALQPDTQDFLAKERVLRLLKPFQLGELAEIIRQACP